MGLLTMTTVFASQGRQMLQPGTEWQEWSGFKGQRVECRVDCCSCCATALLSNSADVHPLPPAVPHPCDVQMPHQYDGNVMVYNFNQGRDDPYPTYLNATLSVGDAWKSSTWAVSAGQHARAGARISCCLLRVSY